MATEIQTIKSVYIYIYIYTHIYEKNFFLSFYHYFNTNKRENLIIIVPPEVVLTVLQII